MLLLLAGLAAPATAQTTVTSDGREGPTACLGQEEVNAANFPITALSTTSITYTTPAITWSEYVGRLGDTPAAASARIFYEVFEVGIGRPVATANEILSSGGQTSSRNLTEGGLSAKTLYYVETAAVARDAGNNLISDIPRQVFARRCFMTGGTYTMNEDPNSTQGRNSGCFTISPLTIQHVRNCWCGRKTTLPLFSSPQDNTDFLNRWGCR